MGDGKRGPTPDEVRRDRIASPQALVGEEGIGIGLTESTKREIDGEPVDPAPSPHPGVAGALGGEFMGPDQRIDGEGEGEDQPLREEDVSEEDALDDDIREGDEARAIPVGAPMPGGVQGEDMPAEMRIDEGGIGPRYPEGDPRND